MIAEIIFEVVLSAAVIVAVFNEEKIADFESKIFKKIRKGWKK